VRRERMTLMTLIARVDDGMPLAANTDNERCRLLPLGCETRSVLCYMKFYVMCGACDE